MYGEAMIEHNKHAAKPWLQKFAIGEHVTPQNSIYRGDLGIIVDTEKMGYRHRVYVVELSAKRYLFSVPASTQATTISVKRTRPASGILVRELVSRKARSDVP